jgi:hypothetical protein
MEEKKSAHRILMGNPDRTISLCKPRHRWKNNIKMDFKETRWEQVD